MYKYSTNILVLTHINIKIEIESNSAFLEKVFKFQFFLNLSSTQINQNCYYTLFPTLVR